MLKYILNFNKGVISLKKRKVAIVVLAIVVAGGLSWFAKAFARKNSSPGQAMASFVTPKGHIYVPDGGLLDKIYLRPGDEIRVVFTGQDGQNREVVVVVRQISDKILPYPVDSTAHPNTEEDPLMGKAYAAADDWRGEMTARLIEVEDPRKISAFKDQTWSIAKIQVLGEGKS